MEYHSDRFEDASLMIHKKNKLVGIIPAHRTETTFNSHGGLTYGGLITQGLGTNDILEISAQLLEFLKRLGYQTFKIKIMPSFLQMHYHSAMEYFLFTKGAQLEGRDMNFVIDLQEPITIHKSKLKKLQAVSNSGLEIRQSKDPGPFWNQVLIPVLRDSHGTQPVHSLEEIRLLMGRFPDNIVQYDVYKEEQIVAGMTLFVDNGVVKSQYGAAHDLGKQLRALDYLYWVLFRDLKRKGFRYFDLGTSTVAKGASYNSGLSRYKEEFGGRPVNLDHYTLAL